MFRYGPKKVREEKITLDKSLDSDSHKPGRRSKKILRNFFIGVVSVFLCFLIIRTFWVQPFKIVGNAMAPYLLTGDRILADKAVYRGRSPERGDIVVYEFPGDKRRFFIHRIAGLPNETVEIKNGSILIDDNPLVDPKVFTESSYGNQGDFALEGQAVRVPQDHYFVFGDNSINSRDGRFFGFVPKKNIKGRVFQIWYPANRRGRVE